LPSFFKVWGKRGMHGTFHQFQQYLLRSLSADDAAHWISQESPPWTAMLVVEHGYSWTI